MEKIPYSSFNLDAWSDTDPSILENAILKGNCTQQMKKDLISRVMKFKEEYDPDFPKGSKTFYLIPVGSEKEAFRNYQLKLARFAALFLPAISLIKRANLPKEIENSMVIAKDESFSYFVEDQYLLAVDMSGKRKNLFFVERPTVFQFCQKKFYLAEKA